MNKVVISVLGQDRPGIIARVSKALFLMNCNIENVSQTIIQAEFSGAITRDEGLTLLIEGKSGGARSRTSVAARSSS